MNKTRNIVTWVFIVIGQIAFVYLFIYLFGLLRNNLNVNPTLHFILIAISIWLGALLGTYIIGIVGLILKKEKPLKAGLRFLVTTLLALVPMLVLIYNGFAVGIDNSPDFQNIVLNKMIPYYTQMSLIFALLGFYVTLWWKKIKPITQDSKKK